MNTSDVSTRPPVELERKHFLELLLANPNYFGTLADSPYKPVQQILSNSSYEELKCVGFNPQLNRLEGVVWIKQQSGFDGGLCTNGSLEYVSFYLSYDGGATWVPQGTTSFPVYDVPGPHPLEYGVSLSINPDQQWCFIDNLPLVRAILSWNVPAAGPASVPVWGNVVDARIQIGGFNLIVNLPDLLASAKCSLPPSVSALVAESATVKLKAPPALSVAELNAQYANSGVPAHRFLKGAIQKAIANPASLLASSNYLNGLGVDLTQVIATLGDTNGNTDFEQLTCIGLDEGTGSPDALVGTLVIKLPSGYLGSPCTAGSREYVAFWVDWGSGWEWQGTASVNVYDIGAIPKEGVNYAVYLPVNLNPHRKPCAAGPVIAPMRAILSWDSPPPPNDPNYVPVWGNSLDTLVLVNPGVGANPGDFTPYLTSICDVPICSIDQQSGWANPGAGDKPFGGSVYIYGSIPGAPLFTSPLPALPKYQVTVQQFDTTTNTLLGAPQILTDPFNVTVYQQIGGGPVTSAPLTQNAPGGYFSYQETTADASGWRIISPQGLLCVWNSSVSTGTWLISVTAWDATLTTQFPAGSVLCTVDGTTRQGVVIDLDQLPPVPDLVITGYMPGGVGPCIAAANCQTFTVGDVICGAYSVSDEHQGGFSLQAEPTPSPTSGFTVDGVSVNGLSYPNPALPMSGSKVGVWTYDTAGLAPCGYTIQLFTNDRTIVSCSGNWQDNSKFVGFCLVAPAPVG